MAMNLHLNCLHKRLKTSSLIKEVFIKFFNIFKILAAINCLVADGKRFAHPLHHLGKSEKDLPVIAIDSFRHMYLFNDFSKIG